MSRLAAQGLSISIGVSFVSPMTSPLRGSYLGPPAGTGLRRLAPGTAVPGETTSSTVVWERQSLADSEAHPLRCVADDYDLVAIDHPSSGKQSRRLLVAADQVVLTARLRELCQSAVGQSSRSYLFGGRQWAVPI